MNKIILPTGILEIDGDAKDVSDGNHTFGELYDHRVLLFLALMVSHPMLSWRASKHEDLTCYEGFFLAGMDLPNGSISYHIPDVFWMLLENKGIRTLEKAPHWDGYTSFDVLERLETFIENL